MKKAELQEKLDQLGVQYDSNATNDELNQLLAANQSVQKSQEDLETAQTDEQEPAIKIVDVVYPLSAESPWDDNELRYSIRSLQKHFRNLGKIFIIGYLPDFIEPDDYNIVHIPFPDSYTENKDANLIAKLLRACQEESLTDEFLFMSDDQYMMQDVYAEHMVPFYSVKLAERRYRTNNKWERRLQRTYQTLKARGIEGYEYDTHAPVIMQKTLFMEVMLSYDWGATPGYCINSLYFSHVLSTHKQRNGEVVRVTNTKEDRAALVERIADAYYLNHNDIALRGAVKDIIEDKFPEPSPFES